MIRALFASVQLSLVLTQVAIAEEAFSTAPFDGLDNVPALRISAEQKMVGAVGGRVYEILSKKITETFKGSVLLDSCIGSFSKLGKTELAVALYNENARKIKYYVVDTTESSNGMFELVGVSQVANESMVRQDVPPLVRCESATSIARLHEIHKARSEDRSTFSNLSKKNSLDSLCLPNGGLIPGYTCFEKIGMPSRWKSIGRWGSPY